MKAIRTHGRTGISGLVFEEVPEVTPMFGDVLVKVAASARWPSSWPAGPAPK